MDVQSDLPDDGNEDMTSDYEQDIEDPNTAVESPKNERARVKNLLAAFDKQDQLELTDEEYNTINNLMHHSGDTMYGIGASTVYVWSSSKLVPLGSYIDPAVLSKVPPDEQDLVSTPQNAYPNVDLVGALLSTKNIHTQHSPEPGKEKKGQHPGKEKKAKGLHWMSLSSVVDDPDQSNSKRTAVMKDAGLEKATGVKFNVAGIQGMVVYYARAGVDQKLLTDPASETYMCRVAYLKGTLLSCIEARRNAMAILPVQSDSAANDSLLQSQTESEALVTPTVAARKLRTNLHRDKIRQHVSAWLKKFVGAGAQIPSCFSWKESIWTAVGTFIGLLLIAVLNKTFKLASDEEHFLILGPFGALMMLQYGLVGSPAGQPRTVMLGHAIAGPIALGLTYVPEEHMPIWIRQILSVTLANFVMVKAGVACPPASAHSLIYADGKHDWQFFGLALVGCLLSFIPAIFFNNLDSKRQYPSFWGYAPARAYHRLMEESQKEAKQAIKVTAATGKQMTKDTTDNTKAAVQVAQETEKTTVDAVKHVVAIPTSPTPSAESTEYSISPAT